MIKLFNIMKLNIKAIIFMVLNLLIPLSTGLSYTRKSSKDVLVNTTIKGDQINSSLITLPHGNYAIAWDTSDLSRAISAQIFDNTMKKVGTEFSIASTSGSDQTDPFVISLAGQSKLVFFWNDLTLNNAMMRFYDYTGAALTDAAIISTVHSSYLQDSMEIRAAANSVGNFAVTWQIENSFGDWDVRARFYDAGGKALTNDILANVSNTTDQSRAAVCTLTNDNFVIVYHGKQTGNYDIYFKIFDKTGANVIKTDTLLNYYTKNDQYYPYCAGLNNGGFVVAFISKYWNSSITDLAFRMFDKDGNPMFNEDRKINTVAADAYIVVDDLPTGGFVVAYNTLGGDVYLQAYAADGTSVYQETVINVYINGTQEYPSLSTYPDGTFVVAWTSQSQTGFDKDIYSQLYGYVKDCYDFKQYVSVGGLSQIMFTLAPSDTVSFVTLPTNGGLYDINNTQLTTNAFYPKTNIYYKLVSTNNSDLIYYVNNKGDLRCKIDIVFCYISCKTCSVTGTSQDNQCTTCLTSDNYYPLTDKPSQCFKMTDTVPGYKFDQVTSSFIIVCYLSCGSCTTTGTTTNNNCTSCLTSGSYYQLYDNPSQCYKNTDIVPGYKFDQTTSSFILACYQSCNTCAGAGTTANNNCTLCLTSGSYYPAQGQPSQCYKSSDIVPKYFFDKVSIVFIPCYISCSFCSAPGNDTIHNCLICDTTNNYYRLSDNPSQCYKSNDTIPHYFFNIDKFSPCDPSCISCANTADYCIGCNYNDHYYRLIDNEHRCIKDTAQVSGYYFDTISKMFQKCYSSCKACYGYKDLYDHMCLECKDSYYPLVDKKSNCYQSYELVDGYYFDANLKIFNKCYSACKTCNGAGTITNPNCLTCKDGLSCVPCINIIYNNQCIKSCPDNLIYDPIANSCYDCIDRSQVKFNGTCLDICPPGYYKSIDTCLTCQSNGQLVSEGNCVNECPIGQVPDNQSNCIRRDVTAYDSSCTDSSCTMAVCTADVCQNGGDCSIEFNKITCSCTPLFVGQYCQIPNNDRGILKDTLSKIITNVLDAQVSKLTSPLTDNNYQLLNDLISIAKTDPKIFDAASVDKLYQLAS
jgi:hypothetical protein